MAVFTKLSDDEILNILSHFNIASVKYIEGIIKGSDNTNYFIKSSRESYVLTILEGRTNDENVASVLDSLTRLFEANILCPKVVTTNSGKRRHKLDNGKICVLQTFVDGNDVKEVTDMQCYAAGKTLASIHKVSENDKMPSFSNCMDIEALEGMVDSVKDKALTDYEESYTAIVNEIDYHKKEGGITLPSGFVHGDYFKDNVLFVESIVSGVIDFWFSCTESYVYDLAIALNAWGFVHGECDEDKFDSFLQGYTERRSLNSEELKYLPAMLRLTALRFFIVRFYDTLNGKCKHTMANKPFQTWEKRLKYHQEKQWKF